MKAIITGANGTIGNVLMQLLPGSVAWNRNTCPPLDEKTTLQFLDAEKPDTFIHLAIASKSTGRPDEGRLINTQWPVQLAEICRERDIRFLLTSTAMVFSERQTGPFTIESPAMREDGYGYEKRQAEIGVLRVNRDARVVRLGWQIGREEGSNNMIDHFEKSQREHGHVSCSTKWMPACSFLEDTAAALMRALDQPPGLYMIDSNTHWNYFDIVTAISELHGKRWKVVANEDLVYDQRLLDPRLNLPPLNQRLPSLA